MSLKSLNLILLSRNLILLSLKLILLSLTFALFKDSLLTAKNRIPARRVSVDFPTHTACAVTTVPICVKMSDKRGMLPLHPAAASEIKGCASAVLGV